MNNTRPKRTASKPLRYQTTSSDESPKRRRISIASTATTEEIDKDIDELRTIVQPAWTMRQIIFFLNLNPIIHLHKTKHLIHIHTFQTNKSTTHKCCTTDRYSFIHKHRSTRQSNIHYPSTTKKYSNIQWSQYSIVYKYSNTGYAQNKQSNIHRHSTIFTHKHSTTFTHKHSITFTHNIQPHSHTSVQPFSPARRNLTCHTNSFEFQEHNRPMSSQDAMHGQLRGPTQRILTPVADTIDNR